MFFGVSVALGLYRFGLARRAPLTASVGTTGTMSAFAWGALFCLRGFAHEPACDRIA